jgi:hypothetical protein
MKEMKTVQIVNPDKEFECIVINKADFDPKVHDLYDAVLAHSQRVEADKKAKAAKAEAKAAKAEAKAAAKSKK